VRPQREVVLAEHAPLGGRGDHEDGVHAAGRHQRYEHRALRPHALGQAAADSGRGGNVVDDDRSGFEGRSGDPRRLVLQVDGDLAPPAGLLAVLHGDEPSGALLILADQRDGGEVDAQAVDDFANQQQAGSRGVRRAEQRVRQRRLRLVIGSSEVLLHALGPAAAEQ
jgi:hypothetical protein